MQLVELAAKLFMQKVGGEHDLSLVIRALADLLPSSGGDLDLHGLLAKFSSAGGLAAMADSWLGDGANTSLSIADIMNFFGRDAVDGFAGKVGLSTDRAAGGLAEMIPELVDKSSAGGSLLQDAAGQLGGRLLGGLFS